MASENAGSFQTIKRLLFQHKQLFEDTDFPANNASIGEIPSDVGLIHTDIKWKRPKDILNDGIDNDADREEPLFIQDGATRADFDQGQVGNCWFIAAAACVAASRKDLLSEIIQPVGQTFSAGDYAGIFRFRFWRYGKWVEVIIDDRLPTVGGELVFAHNMNQRNEFWAALMEKAYAKLHGSYFSLDSGYTEDAMVDLTGGISRWYKLDDPTSPHAAPQNLYQIMHRVVQSNCLMSCSIPAPRLEWHSDDVNGLYKGHAYSITAVTEIQMTDGQKVKLIRLRNPWGQGTWFGDWSETSDLWDRVDQRTKEMTKFNIEDGGEFWMSYGDWLHYFEYYEMCYLSADEMINPLTLASDKPGWRRTRYLGNWEPGVNAGGRPIQIPPAHGDYYWKNPQYRVYLPRSNSPQDGTNFTGTMLVSLMEVDSRKKDKDVRIGVSVYSEPKTAALPFGQTHKLMVESDHSYDREVTAHFTGKPGNYIVIPSTFQPNQKASFLLRIFTE